MSHMAMEKQSFKCLFKQENSLIILNYLSPRFIDNLTKIVYNIAITS